MIITVRALFSKEITLRTLILAIHLITHPFLVLRTF